MENNEQLPEQTQPIPEIQQERFSFIVVPLNVLATATAYFKEDSVDKSSYESRMNDFVIAITNHPDMAGIFHSTMIEMTKIGAKLVEADERFKDIVPSFMSFVPSCWFPEDSEEKRKMVFDFSEKFRKEMEHEYERQQSAI